MPVAAAPLPPALTEAAKLDDEALIRLILTFHEAHIRDLAAAIDLAERVGRVHGPGGGFPTRLPGELQDLLGDLQTHQAREESALFPQALAGRRGLRAPLCAMSTDHEAAQDRLERLVRLTEDFTPPAQACQTWRRLYDICRRFDRDFRIHAQLEERVLFPRLQ